ncbi:MAG: PilZ domain-containing protein [Pseudobutyrivibrio sp.]|nr:PilZ domain-containing protein [Pseudobutyrivibrio sp.]
MVEKKRIRLSIADINSEITLSVLATLDNKTIELPVEYAKLTEEELSGVRALYGPHVLPLENVVKEWQEKLMEVSFKGHLSKLELLAVNTEGVFLWDNVKIYKVKLTSGKTINILKAPAVEGEKFNRRRGVRIALDKSMQLQQEGSFHTVIVRDLSYCGIGFIEPGKSSVEVGKSFILFLTEDTEDGEKIVGKFVGKVINQRDLPAGGVFSGCILSAQHSTFLQRYIAMKQLEQISGRRQNISIQRTEIGVDWKSKIVDSLVESLNE